MNGEIVFHNAEPISLPSPDALVGVAVNMNFEDLRKVRVVMDTVLTKKAMKGWQIWGKSELRDRALMVSTTVLNSIKMIEECTGRDQIQKEMAAANASMDRLDGIVNTPQPAGIKVNRKEAIKHLNSQTTEFVTFATNTQE